jgi:hypothetical protein
MGFACEAIFVKLLLPIGQIPAGQILAAAFYN